MDPLGRADGVEGAQANPANLMWRENPGVAIELISTQALLTNNGIDPGGINLDSVRLYHMGEEVSILVNDLDSPGVFDATDFI